ncbi:MAG TPA: response regulator [Acidimicrobiales bacterium]|nr:response regulator [Acidimicrobiales bacterium]
MASGGAEEDRITVVVADDAEDIRLMLRLSLERDGDMKVVAEAADGAAAVAMAGLHHPDVLILDLNMPGMDGRATIPAVLQASPLTRVVVMSGHDHSYAEADVLALGAIGYVEKGGSATATAEAVRRLASGH